MTSILSIGLKIKSVRKAQKKSAEAVAKDAFVHANTLRALEKGTGNVELSRLLSIVDALGLDLLLVPKAISGAPLVGESLELTSFAKGMEALMPGIYK